MSTALTIRSSGLSPHSVRHAALPTNYEAAKASLAACDSVDECREWVNRTAAAASYAKQARDMTLYRYARLIRLRALRRLGQLIIELGLIQSESVPLVGSKSRVTMVKHIASLSENDFTDIEARAVLPTDEAICAMNRSRGDVKRRPWAPETSIRISARAYLHAMQKVAKTLSVNPIGGGNPSPQNIQQCILALPPFERAALCAAVSLVQHRADLFMDQFNVMPMFAGSVDAGVAAKAGYPVAEVMKIAQEHPE